MTNDKTRAHIQRRKDTHMLDDTAIEAVRAHLDARKATHLEHQVQVYRGEIDGITQTMEGRRRNIVNDLNRLAVQRDLLRIAMEAAGDRTYVDHLLTEWADLSVHPRLESASMNGGEIELVTTDDIRLHREDSEETRWLGSFRIMLDLDSGAIMLHNRNTRRGGRDHPHVVNGNPCFGSDHGVFSELMAAGSLNVLYEMLLQYLEKLNLRDEYGAYGAYWFEQPDVRPEGAPAPEPEPELSIGSDVMSVLEFGARYGNAEFICHAGPYDTDRPGQRGRVRDYDEVGASIEWLDSGRVESRGGGLIVTATAEVMA